MRNKTKLLACILFVGLITLFSNKVYAKEEKVILSISCFVIDPETQKTSNELGNYSITIEQIEPAGDTVTIYSNGAQLPVTNSSLVANLTFKEGEKINLRLTMKPDGMGDFIFYTDGTRFDNGLIATISSPTQLLISGKIKKVKGGYNRSLILYGVPSSTIDSIVESDPGNSVQGANTVTAEDDVGTITKGSLAPKDANRIVLKVIDSSMSSKWSKILTNLKNFKNITNIITNGLLMITIFTGLLVIIVQATKIPFMPSHPMQRRKALEDIVAVIVCIACTGSIKLLTILIMGIAAG